jgi:hypothetical protein
LWWKQTVQREREREATSIGPDVIIIHQKHRTCKMINLAISTNRNFEQKEVENKEKYESLRIEMKQTWNMKCSSIPVHYRTTRRVMNVIKQNVEATAREHSVDVMKQTAVLRIYNIMWKILQYENGTVRWGSAGF